ncbi:MAG: SDR family oxidoreductase [Patescibacteria group bacterium]|nr:SDR family oxidoreductase [Patescibacteria group bacterium]
MLKIAITGASGLVGSRIIDLLGQDFTFIPISHNQLDITNKEKVFRFFGEISFDFLIHLAAYTNVTKAEEEKEIAYLINVKGTSYLFDLAVSKKKKFIFFSTDFVFSGKNPPYFENSKPEPVGVYGLTKYQAELLISPKTYPNSMIIRIAYPYRAQFRKKADFFRKFKSFLEEKKPLKMITDALMTPTFIDDIAIGLKYLVKNFTNDIFHLVGSQSLSPFEAASLIARVFNLDKDLISKISFEEYVKNHPGIPQFSEIKSKKNIFFRMKSFEEGLSAIKKQLSLD